MVRSRTGQRKTTDRTLQHGSPASGSDFLTLSPSASNYYHLGRVRGARSRDSLSVLPASNGLQGSQTSIVRAHSRVDVDACDVNLQRKVLSMGRQKAVIKARREAKRVLRRDSRSHKQREEESVTSLVQMSGVEAIGMARDSRDTSPIEARNEAQAHYLNAIDNKQLIFATGEAGCGKTWISAAKAAEALIHKDVDRIIVTRPVLQADEGDEQADTGGDGGLDRSRDGIEDHLAKTRDRQQDEHDAVNEDEHEGVRVAQAEGKADGVDKEGVQTHAGGLRQREVRQQADEDCADDGGNGGRDIDRAVAHGAEGGEHAGVDHQNIGHRHERGDARHDLGLDGRTMFFYLKETFHL